MKSSLSSNLNNLKWITYLTAIVADTLKQNTDWNKVDSVDWQIMMFEKEFRLNIDLSHMPYDRCTIIGTSVLNLMSSIYGML